MKTYFLDLPDNNTGKLTQWVFPEVDEPSDTPMMQALRRSQLERDAKRMADHEKEKSVDFVHPKAS